MSIQQDSKNDAAQTIAQLALELHSQTGVAETVDAVLRFALQAINCDHANLALAQRHGVLEVVGATDPISRQGIALQLGTGQGPSLAAVDTQVAVLVTDTAAEDRWATWAVQAADLGIRSVLSIPVQVGQTTLGALNLTADKPYAFEPDDYAVADLLARHAAVAVANAQQAATLTQAIDARTVIGQAQGILMERFSVTEDEAFAILRRYSQDHNTKLREVARGLTTTRELPTGGKHRLLAR